jgi:hypothetical protein
LLYAQLPAVAFPVVAISAPHTISTTTTVLLGHSNSALHVRLSEQYTEDCGSRIRDSEHHQDDRRRKPHGALAASSTLEKASCAAIARLFST